MKYFFLDETMRFSKNIKRIINMKVTKKVLSELQAMYIIRKIWGRFFIVLIMIFRRVNSLGMIHSNFLFQVNLMLR